MGGLWELFKHVSANPLENMRRRNLSGVLRLVLATWRPAATLHCRHPGRRMAPTPSTSTASCSKVRSVRQLTTLIHLPTRADLFSRNRERQPQSMLSPAVYKVTIQETPVVESNWKVVAAGTWTPGSSHNFPKTTSPLKYSKRCSMLSLQKPTNRAGTKCN